MEILSDERRFMQESVKSGHRLTPLSEKDPNSLGLPTAYLVSSKSVRISPLNKVVAFISRTRSLPL